MTRAVLAGFAVGAIVVLAVLFRQLADNAEKMRAQSQADEAAEEWRRFLAKWEAA